MIDILLFINSLFAVYAVILGSCSRNVRTALVTGLFIGLIHAGIVALWGAQSHTMPVSTLPYVQHALDAAMATGRFTFHNARYALYLAGAGLALMALTVFCYLARRIVCRIACLLMPKKKTATQG
jgi:hypothetical protein